MMRGSPTAQGAFAILCTFVACWYTYILQVHTGLEVDLDHRRGEAMFGASCSPFESSGAKVHVQPTVTAVSFYTLHYALSYDTPWRS